MKPIVRRLQKPGEEVPVGDCGGEWRQARRRPSTLRNGSRLSGGENESLAETTARALGINTFELRALLQQRAAGLVAE